MFSCMVEIHNMHRIGEVFLNYMSNPVGSVPQDHNFSCSVQSTSVGKRIKEATKLFYIEPSCHILNGSGLIEKDAWHQFRTLTTGDAFKNRSHFDLSIDICFALGFLFFHRTLVVGSPNGHFSHQGVELLGTYSYETLLMSTFSLSSGRSLCLFC